MRITTGQVLRNYQTGLARTNSQLADTREKVMSKRNFSTISQDPAASVRAFKLRKDYLANEDYMQNVKSVSSHYDAVESSAMQMADITKEANALILEGINGASSPEQRATIASSLRGMQESLVLSANAKFGDSFILGGQNTTDVPFELKQGKLLYQGKDVSDLSEQANLSSMANQKIMVDLGFGLEHGAGGEIVNNSAFNMAFSGLNALGFGQENGNDKNIVTLIGQLADELEKPVLDTDKIKELTNNFNDSRNKLIDFVTDLGTKSNFLEQTESRLKDNSINLNEKLVALENVNLADAITDYSWAQFAYNAALKVGNGILSQSFIDFMR